MQLFVLLICFSIVGISHGKPFEGDANDSGKKRKYVELRVELMFYADEPEEVPHGNLRGGHVQYVGTGASSTVTTIVPTIDPTDAPAIAASEESSDIRAGNKRQDDDAPVFDGSISAIVTHYMVRVPTTSFHIMKVFNFDKHNDVLDLSKFNFRRREDIPVTRDKDGNEVITVGKQSVVFIGAGEGVIKSLRPDQIRLGKRSEDPYAKIQVLESLNFALTLLLSLLSAVMLGLWYHGNLIVPLSVRKCLCDATEDVSYFVLPPPPVIDPIELSNAIQDDAPNEFKPPSFPAVVCDKASDSVSLTPIDLIVSPFSEIGNRVVDMTNRGIIVYDVSLGEPTNHPPAEVIQALISGAENGVTRYTSVEGRVQLREGIKRDFLNRKGIWCTTDRIVVSHGAKQAIAQAILACVKPGTKVIIPAPHWPVFFDMVRMAGAIPVSAMTFREDGYNLRPEVLKKLLDTHQPVSCLLLCNPNNPTGAVPSREQLMVLAAVLRDYPDVIVISDEVYDRIVFDGAKHTSFATLPEMEDRTITVTGPSKAFCMTGLRIGFSVSPPKIAESIAKVQASITNCASSVAQHATLGIYSEGAIRWCEENVKELQRKRDLCVTLLRTEPALRLPFNVPQGAYYLFLDVSAYMGRNHTALGETVAIHDSTSFSRQLLNVHHVAVVPGVAFGLENHIRLHFAVSEDVLREVIARLKMFLSSLTE